MTNRALVYPDWVQQYRDRGTTIKKKDGNYYLYKRTSKRVPGKKYPQPIDTYLGVITPDGVINAEKKLVSTSSEWDVFEYGFSKALLTTCPEDWKKSVGDDWKQILMILIVKESKLSFLPHDFTIPDEEEYHVSWGALYSALIRRIKNEYKAERRELEQLKHIFVIYHDKSRFLSRISVEQQAVLNKLHMPVLEVG